MSERYLIKKYSSRRLYDAQTGNFVTLAELDQLIRQGKTIEVRTAKGVDETRGILLQILLERESAGEPLLSNDMLHSMVRMYGHAMQTPFGKYLEDGVTVMREQHDAWQSRLPNTLKKSTQTVVENLVSQTNQWLEASSAMWLGEQPEPKPKRAAAKSRPTRKSAKK